VSSHFRVCRRASEHPGKTSKLLFGQHYHLTGTSQILKTQFKLEATFPFLKSEGKQKSQLSDHHSRDPFPSLPNPMVPLTSVRLFRKKITASWFKEVTVLRKQDTSLLNAWY
jgi:hypothetical protein